MVDGVFSFQWHLTDHCPGRCRHCYQERHDRGGELPEPEFWKLVDRLLHQLGGEDWSVNLTGGEPLTFAPLAELMERMETAPGLRRVDIITSGFGIEDTLLARLARCDKLRRFKLSLEAPDARQNDAVRGPGAFLATCRAARCLRETTGRQVVLMSTLGTHNYRRVKDLVELARELDLQGVIFERFVPLGRGRDQARWVLGPRHWGEVVEQVLRVACCQEDVAELAGYHAFWLELGEGGEIGVRAAGCNLGPDSMALMPDGRVYPCRRLPMEIGNLAREDLAEIRRRLREFTPQRLRPRLSGPACRHCRVSGCAGCRALARAVGGDWLADDPRCLLASGTNKA